MVFIIFGCICLVMGIIWAILFLIYVHKQMKLFADNSLAEYEDDESVPDNISKHVFMQGLKRTIILSLLNALITCIFVVIAWLFIRAGLGLEL